MIHCVSRNNYSRLAATRGPASGVNSAVNSLKPANVGPMSISGRFMRMLRMACVAQAFWITCVAAASQSDGTELMSPQHMCSFC